MTREPPTSAGFTRIAMRDSTESASRYTLPKGWVASRHASFATKGISFALVSAFFLGLAPVFGKQAILFGISPLAVVAIRTLLAALLLLLVMFLFFRPFLYIYPAGMLGCLIAGWLNGLGSLFYYSALGRIDASLGQLLFSLYPLFLFLWLSFDRQRPSRLTIFRLILAVPALVFLVQAKESQVDTVGILQMLVASALYALHIPFNQRVLLDMPAPTVTLYTLLAMSAIVLPTFVFSGGRDISLVGGEAPTFTDLAWPLLALTLVTFISRLALFQGVKHLGGLQTAMLGLSELLVTLIFANVWLGEILTTRQWVGAGLLIFSLVLVAFEKPPPKKISPGGFLGWLRPSGQATDVWQPHD